MTYIKNFKKFMFRLTFLENCPYNTCTLLSNNVRYVDNNLDAPDNAISSNEPSSEMLTSQSQISE